MNLEDRIQALIQLGQLLAQKPTSLEAAVHRAYAENRWFIPENSWLAVEAVQSQFLSEKALRNWTKHYQLDHIQPKVVGLILAGNIPLVGIHDILAVFISGHRSKIKISDKDKALTTFMIKALYDINPEIENFIEIVDRLVSFDVIIATGSDNTARYFKTYFGKYPNIIRHNRNSVAILTGNETKEDLKNLGLDVFSYFGLGCRNVSKIYVPKDYDFQLLLETWHDHFKEIVLNDKYKNNFDYAFTLYIMNKEFYMNNGCIILHKAESLSSRISTLHYEFYDDLATIEATLAQRSEEIQCVASQVPFENLPWVPLGTTQTPTLLDYADGVDVLEFLMKV